MDFFLYILYNIFGSDTMDKIILVNKDKGMTSRDVCNSVSRLLNEKKVGHFGTLDPMATGLLVLGLGTYTKIESLLTNSDKKYEVEVLVGKSTDTYDITGNSIDEDYDKKIDITFLKKILSTFIGTYMQEVPIYSAVRVNGKRLYKYAREGKKVILPKKEVTIYNIDNISLYKKDNNTYFSFNILVSSGTYIRSLINDISKKIDIPMCMSALNRTMCCSFNIKDSSTLDDIKSGNYKSLDLEDFLDLEIMEIPSFLEKKVLNGNKIDVISNRMILFRKNNKNIALYKSYGTYMKPNLVFKNTNN